MRQHGNYTSLIKRGFVYALSVILLSTSSVQVYALEVGDYSGQDIYFYSKTATCTVASDSSSGALVGSGNIEKIYNYMIGKGLTDYQAAGVVGNIAIESHGDPTLVQISAQKTYGEHINDPTPMGTSVGGGKAWGIIQWDAGGRAVAYAKQAGITAPIYELSTQLDLVWWHMTTETPTSKKNFIDEYKKTTTVEDATNSYEQGMEGAGHPSMTDRIAAAQSALKKYGSGTTGSADNDVVTAYSATTTASGCGTGTPSTNGQSVLEIAKAELAKNVSEWDSNALKYTDGHKWAWCASFVSWVYKQAGTPFTDGYPQDWLIPGVKNMRAWFMKNGTYFKVGEQTPQPGDVAFYVKDDFATNGLKYTGMGIEHVNIVETVSADGKTMSAIGGNQSNRVTRYDNVSIVDHQYALVGFGRMK